MCAGELRIDNNTAEYTTIQTDTFIRARRIFSRGVQIMGLGTKVPQRGPGARFSKNLRKNPKFSLSFS